MPTGTPLEARPANSAGDVRAAVEAAIARVEALNPSVNAFITVCARSALETACSVAEHPGRAELPLGGVTVAVKDNIDTAGVRTTGGSAMFAERVPERDATVVRRLRTGGAICLGKVALHELAFGVTSDNPFFGPCLNPWDTERIPGGSSGGSAVAVAADLCDLALGTDTAGSIRIPAALTGVSGLRPTRGSVPTDGVLPVSATLDTVGLIARSAAMLAVGLDVLTGRERGEPPDPAPPRVGLPAAFFYEGLDPEVAAAVDAALDMLAGAGATIVEVSLEGADEAYRAAGRITVSETYGVHRERLAAAPGDFGEDVRRRLEAGAAITPGQLVADRETARRWARAVDGALTGVDVLAMPTTSCVAPERASAESLATTAQLTRLTAPWSLSGSPAVSIPCGLTPAGLPVGLQLVGRRQADRTVLGVAELFQRVTAWHEMRPPLLDHEPPASDLEPSGRHGQGSGG